MGQVLIYGTGGGGGDLGAAYSRVATTEYTDSLMGAWWKDASDQGKLGATLNELIQDGSFGAYKNIKSSAELFANADALNAFLSSQAARQIAFYSLYCVTEIAADSTAFAALITDIDRLVDFIQSVIACYEMLLYENNVTALTGSVTAMDAIANSATAMDAAINSTVAMDAIANSTVAMDAIANSTTAMDAIANSTIAMDAIINSTIAMDAIANSTIAMDAIINSTIAMDAIANSTVAATAIASVKTAVKAICDSDIAYPFIESSSTLLNALIANATTKTSTLNTTLTTAYSGYCLTLKVRTTQNPGNIVNVTTKVRGSAATSKSTWATTDESFIGYWSILQTQGTWTNTSWVATLTWTGIWF